MIEFAVCDDDIAFANILAEKINHLLFGVPEDIDYYVHKFYSSRQVMKYVETKPINVLFLDIDMPEKNGFQVAEFLQQKSPDTIIIFVSAYDRFVYESFRFTPFCFLRKECIASELKNTLQNVLDKFFESTSSVIFESMDGNVNIRTKDIVYIESVKNYYVVHCKSEKSYKCRGTLASIEQKLNPINFIRAHKAFIINIHNVIAVHANRKIILYPNIVIHASSRKWSAFNSAYMEYTRRRIIS